MKAASLGIVIGLALAAAARAAETGPAPLPRVDDVTLTASVDKPEIKIGEPVMVRLTYRNTGTKTYWVEEDHLGWFHFSCTVKDEAGRPVENPFGLTGLEGISGPFSRHTLPPGGSVNVSRLLNECVVFRAPGTYALEPVGLVGLD